jgi:arylsulfatase A-like enzyme
MVSWIDILPSLVEVAGGTAPKDIDGRSFAGVLRGQQKEHRDRIFTTHSSDGQMNIYPIRSVRTEAWKYIRNLHPEFYYSTHIDLVPAEDGPGYFASWREEAKTNAAAAAIVKHYHERPAEELYDLNADPLELKNLAPDPRQAARLATMRTDLDAWMREQGDAGRVFGEPRLLTDPRRAEPPPAAKNPKKL